MIIQDSELPAIDQLAKLTPTRVEEGNTTCFHKKKDNNHNKERRGGQPKGTNKEFQ